MRSISPMNLQHDAQLFDINQFDKRVRMKNSSLRGLRLCQKRLAQNGTRNQVEGGNGIKISHAEFFWRGALRLPCSLPMGASLSYSAFLLQLCLLLFPLLQPLFPL